LALSALSSSKIVFIFALFISGLEEFSGKNSRRIAPSSFVGRNADKLVYFLILTLTF
jgi:hypothetical protein